jgi:putative intracellular protease/amidase
VAARAGRIPLTPSTITVEPDMTLAAFDSAVPTGADYVIVPAMVDPENPAVRAWLKVQAAHGAVIVSICEGARVVAGAGLLEGKRATTHWHALDDLEKHYPGTTWVRNARYVVSDGRISTTGVSASLPVSLYLVERIAGRAVADSAARALGVDAWDTAHDTDAFQLTRWMYLKAATTYLVRRPRDVIAVPVANGVDEVALAFTLDAIPRTMRARSLTWSADGESVVSRQGLRISVDAGPLRGARTARRLVVPSVRPASALDSAIAQLGAWYGADARELIAVGMEYRLRPQR